MSISVILLHPKAQPDDLGMIPGMLDADDPRPAREQFDANYQHGGGWRPGAKHTMRGVLLCYPGDPPMRPIAVVVFRAERILIYPYAFVAIVQPDGSFEAARMD